MEPIQKELASFMKNEQFQKRYQQMKQEILRHPMVLQLIQSNVDEWTDERIDANLKELYEYITQLENCRKCQSLQTCENIIEGYEPNVVSDQYAITLVYDKCGKKRADEEKNKYRTLVKSMHIPSEILDATIQDIHFNEPGREEIKMAVMGILDSVKEGNFTRGLYISGSFGVGKTYILGALANYLALEGYASLLIYFPEFIREMKSSIQSQSLEGKLEAVKKAQVLMIDDIGAESVSSFTRDEILGPILQYRMLEKLPTFFTSNFTHKELEQHLAISQRGDEEYVKAKRVMERVRALSIPVSMSGKNRRD